MSDALRPQPAAPAPVRMPHLELASAPFVRSGLATPRLMLEVLLALVPVVAMAVWIFGVSALLVVLASVIGALITERWLGRPRSSAESDTANLPARPSDNPLGDGSALLTGVLLALTLPPGLPLWMAFLGGVAAIALGKAIFGGLGRNLFNPALVGRAFLQAAFPTALTTWTPPVADRLSLLPATLAPPFLRPATTAVDGLSGATPLGLAKFAGQGTELDQLVLGQVAGSLGETAGGLLLLCGVWLMARKVFDWRLPVSTLVGVGVFSGLLHLWLPERCPDPLFMWFSGGLLFAAVFMVTDPVTSPLSPRGEWIFGLGVAFLVVLIRCFGGLPEGVMYSILLMNAVTPLIDRVTQPRPFGRRTA